MAVLAPHPSILDIAPVYLHHYLMPRTLRGDALHLTYASYYNMDFLLTWTCDPTQTFYGAQRGSPPALGPPRGRADENYGV